MADKTYKQPENVPGAWYVDTNCIICGLCSEYAPAVFKPSDDFDHNYVHHQPTTPTELNAAEEVRQLCPVDAIGRDAV
ncbi:MAG: ferredoxin [Verrucomicrobia subdivision 3 bacterium]|nr:ferredoxin [Limisphaerales bacterium]